MKKVVAGLSVGAVVITVFILVGIQIDQSVQVSDQKINEEKSALIEEGHWDQADEIQKDLLRIKRIKKVSITGKKYKYGVPSVMDIARGLRDRGEYHPDISVSVPANSVVRGNIIARDITCESNVTVIGNLVAKDVVLHEGCEVLGDINSPQLTLIGSTDLALETIKVSGERPEKRVGYRSRPETKMEMYRH